MLLGADALLTKELGPAIGNFFCLSLILVHPEFFSGLGSTVQSKYNCGGGRRNAFNSQLPFIEHCFYSSVILTRYQQVSYFQASILNKKGGYEATSFIKRSFYNCSGCFTVWISLQIKQLSFQQYFF